MKPYHRQICSLTWKIMIVVMFFTYCSSNETSTIQKGSLALNLNFQGELSGGLISCPEAKFPLDVTHVLVEVSGFGFSKRFDVFPVDSRGELNDIPVGENRTVRIFGIDGTGADVYDPETWIYAQGEKFDVTVKSNEELSSEGEFNASVFVDIGCLPATMRFLFYLPEDYNPFDASIFKLLVTLSDDLHGEAQEIWDNVSLTDPHVDIDEQHKNILPGRNRIVRVDGFDSSGRLIARGENRHVDLQPGQETQVPIFFAPLETFSLLEGRMTQGRADHEIAISDDGKIFINGGLLSEVGMVKQSDLFLLNTSLTQMFVPIVPLDLGTGSVCDNYKPLERYGHSVTTLVNAEGGVEILIAGGLDANGNATRLTEIFDSETGRICPGPTMVKARAFHTATRLTDGRVLITGGLSHLNVGEALPEGVTGILKSAEIFENRAFISLLSDQNCPCADSQLRQCLYEGRAGHTSTLLPDGTVFITGGLTEKEGKVVTTQTIERFLPRSKVFELYLSDTQVDECKLSDPLPENALKMCFSRAFHQATLIKHPSTTSETSENDPGLMILTGGLSLNDTQTTYLSDIELFDPKNRTIFLPQADGSSLETCEPNEETIHMICRRAFHQATAIDQERIVITGGTGGNNEVGQGERCFTGTGSTRPLDTVEIFSSLTYEIQRDKMNLSRTNHRQILLPECMLFITGGFTRNNSSALNSSEIYPLAPLCIP